MAMRKRRKITRQDWKPNALLRLGQAAVSGAWALAKLAVGGVATVLFILVVCGFVLISALGDYLQDDVVPSVSFDLGSYDLEQTSFIYSVDKDGQIQKYQKIYTDTDRQWASIDEIPEDLVHAAVAIEDKRFYEHQGVDWITTVKACANMFFGGSSSFGGSTITQQFIKNRTGDNDITVQRKVEEIFRAYKFEQEYDKDVVMEWYLNEIYLGESCYGVKSAARVYFGKELEDLTTAECASLISITNNPSLYDPYISERCRERNYERYQIVLSEMNKQGWITDEEYEVAKNQELFFTSASPEIAVTEYTCTGCGFTAVALDFDRDGDTFLCPECGVEADIEVDSSTDMYSWFTEMVLDDVAQALAEKDGAEWNNSTKQTYLTKIKKGGYHIYSTIDTDVQAAVDSVYTDLSQIPTTASSQQLLSAMVLIDNSTGDIVAVAGNVGEKTSFDAFNHATDEGKQTGSAMKPLAVYAPAFESGMACPATVIDDLPLTYDGGKFPLNDTRTYRISTSIYTGIVDSINTISVNTLDMITTRYSFDFAKDKFRLHGLLESEITSSGRELTDIGYSPLGMGALTYGVTIRDMANAYATFPSDGLWREARTFTKVYDSAGNLIIDNTQDSEQILSTKTANYINYCLRGVVRNGSAYYAAIDQTMVAGKTGTTSDDKDRWFCGYTEYYTAAVWCGYKYPETIRLTNVYTNPSGRLFQKVMSKIHNGKGWKDVYTDSGMYYVTICLDSGALATDACKADPRANRTQQVLVYPGDAPTRSCTDHIVVEYCTSGNGYVNEYCKQVQGLTFAKRALVKYTQKEIDNIKKARDAKNFTDDIIYLVDNNGKPLAFHGINGNINKGLSYPYKACTVHTADSVKPPETEPPAEETTPDNDPTEPTEAP